VIKNRTRNASNVKNNQVNSETKIMRDMPGNPIRRGKLSTANLIITRLDHWFWYCKHYLLFYYSNYLNEDSKHTEHSCPFSEGSLFKINRRKKVRSLNDYCWPWRSYELPYIASTVVVPLLKPEMDKWNVLDEPRRFRDEFNVWRDLLMISTTNQMNPNKRPEPGTQVRPYTVTWNVRLCS